MAAEWIERLTGSLEEKRAFKRHEARLKALPEPYRAAGLALERYTLYAGGLADGAVMVRMMDDLASLLEESAANGSTLETVLGDDPAEFAEEFLANYKDASWITKEKRRLNRAIAEATADAPGRRDRGSGS